METKTAEIERLALGKKIRDLRISRNISQKELADLSDMHQQQVNRYEKGRALPSERALRAIAKGLKLRSDYFKAEDQHLDDEVYEAMVKEYHKMKLTSVGKRMVLDLYEVLGKCEQVIAK